MCISIEQDRSSGVGSSLAWCRAVYRAAVRSLVTRPKMIQDSLCGNLRNEDRSFKVGRLQSFVIWKCGLLKTKATVYQSRYWNPSCLFFSNLNQMRIKLIFAKQIEMKRKIPISLGKLHMKNKCIFSSFNMIYSSPPLFWPSIFFPLIVKAHNPVLLSGSRYFTHAASSAYFPSAMYKGGHRLSACWTVISSQSAGDEDAKIFFVVYGAASCQVGERGCPPGARGLSQTRPWKLRLRSVPTSQCAITSNSRGSGFKIRVVCISEEKDWLAAVQHTDGCSKEATCRARLDWLKAGEKGGSKIKESSVGEKEAALKKWV